MKKAGIIIVILIIDHFGQFNLTNFAEELLKLINYELMINLQKAETVKRNMFMCKGRFCKK